MMVVTFDIVGTLIVGIIVACGLVKTDPRWNDGVASFASVVVITALCWMVFRVWATYQ